MIATACFAFVLAFASSRASRQRRATLWVESHGGVVSFRDQHKLPENIDPLSIGTGSIFIREPPVPNWMLRLFDIHYFWDVTEVDLAGRNIKSIDLLTDLPELEWLDLRDTNLADEQLERLHAAIPGCEILSGPFELEGDPFAQRFL